MSALPDALRRLADSIPPDAELDTALLSAAARSAVQRGELKGARALLLLLVNRDPAHAAAWSFLAVVLRDLGAREDAVYAVERALALAPGDLFSRGVARALGVIASEVHHG